MTEMERLLADLQSLNDSWGRDAEVYHKMRASLQLIIDTYKGRGEE